MRRTASLCFLCGIVGFSRGAWAGAPVACSPAVFGDPAQDPLTIAGDWDLPPACTLDFGGRKVILEGSLAGEDLTVLAGELEMASTGKISGGGALILILLEANAIHGGSAHISGLLESKGTHGGGIVIDAEGSFTLSGSGRIEASALTPTGSGGYVAVEADGEVDVSAGAVLAFAGQPGGFGGDVSMVSIGSSVALGAIDVSGGPDSRGAVIASAAGLLSVLGPIAARGACFGTDCSPGGVVQLTAGGSLLVKGPITAMGPVGALYAADGSGGVVTLDAGGNIFISRDAPITLSASSEFSKGGSLEAQSGGDFSQEQGNTVNASGRADGGTSSGGTLRIDSAGGAEVLGSLMAAGSEYSDGGTIAVVAVEDVFVDGTLSASGNYPTGGIEIVSRTGAIALSGLLTAEATGAFGTGGTIGLYAVTGISVDGDRGGSTVLNAGGFGGEDGLGGTVRLDSFQEIQVANARLEASGVSGVPGEGTGGLIELEGCSLRIGPAATLDASGREGGVISLTSSSASVISASASASAGGIIQIRYPSGEAPDLSGSDFAPDPSLEATLVLEPCFLGSTVQFIRGDCSFSQKIDISDAIMVLGFLFQGSPQELACEKACDFNDDGKLDISDSIRLLNVLFVVAGEGLPAPFEGCGADPTEDSLACAGYECP